MRIVTATSSQTLTAVKESRSKEKSIGIALGTRRREGVLVRSVSSGARSRGGDPGGGTEKRGSF